MEEFDWQQIAAQAAQGDREAFEKLYKQTERSVYFTCLKLLGNEHDAKDIMQETYIKAFEKLSDMNDYSKFPEWINRIAVNNCKMFFRKPKPAYIEDSLGKTEEIVDEKEIIPSDYVSDAEKRHLIMSIIDTKLSDVQRQAIILYYYDEMSVAEIAEIMECPEGTVKYRLSTAREKIREAILIYEKENDDKLYAFLPVPVLTSILRKEAEEIIVPKIQLFEAAAISSQQSASRDSNHHSNKKGKNNMTKALQSKIIAGVAAAVILVGGGIAAVSMMNKGDSENSIQGYSSQYDNNNSNKPEDGNTMENSSSHNPPETGSSSQATAETEGSKRPSKDDERYPQFDGLEVIKLAEITDDRYHPGEDWLSGTLKDMYTKYYDGVCYIVLLDENGVIYLCSRDTFGAPITEIGRDTGIEHFDCIRLITSWGSCDLTVIDGNHIYYKALDSEGNTRLEKSSSIPLDFQGTILEGKKIRDVNLSSTSYNICIVDEDGVFYSGSQWYSYDEAGTPSKRDVFLDTAGLYLNRDERSDRIEPEGEEVVQIIEDRYILTASGRIYFRDSGRTLFEKEPLESVADLKIAGIFGREGTRKTEYLSILTEDNRIVTVDVGIKRSNGERREETVFEADVPSGKVLNIHTNDERIIVQTDTGYYYANIGDNKLVPFDTFNNLPVEVVRVYNDKVLLSNGYVYEILFND